MGWSSGRVIEKFSPSPFLPISPLSPEGAPRSPPRRRPPRTPPLPLLPRGGPEFPISAKPSPYLSISLSRYLLSPYPHLRLYTGRHKFYRVCYQICDNLY